jgi:Na+/H+-dicarboxylate symporter
MLLTALSGSSSARSIGSLGVRTVSLFVVFLSVAGLATVACVSPVVGVYPVDPGVVETLRTTTAIPPAAMDAGAGLFLAFTVFFGLGVAHLPEDQRLPLASLFKSLSEAMMQIIFWILWVTPLAVFSLVLGLAMHSGPDALGLLGFYILIVSCWMLGVTAILYFLIPILGRVPPRAFARALAAAQMVALSTRSSLASLPALIKGGRDHLGLGPEATGFVLPLAASSFKLSTMTAEPVRYLFLAHLFGMHLTLPQTGTFLLTLGILSFAGVGIPRGGSGFDTLPAYAAAGIPIEGLVLVVAVDTIPDIAKTLINVTGYMSVATLATRRSRVQEAVGRPAT